LDGEGPPEDAGLKIVVWGTPRCTIHSCSMRPLNESDIKILGHEVPPYDLKLNPGETARRIAEQTAGLPDRPEVGAPFKMKIIDAAMRWIPERTGRRQGFAGQPKLPLEPGQQLLAGECLPLARSRRHCWRGLSLGATAGLPGNASSRRNGNVSFSRFVASGKIASACR
jgi:hypothetical protein